MAVANLSLRAWPMWARPDHPLVRRELRALPPCLGRDRSWRFWLALIGVAGVGGYGLANLLALRLPWNVAWLAISWLPLLWATRIIARETAADTWDVLRSTPYSLGEIVRAKLVAVGRITAPLLIFLLVGALATSRLAAFAGAWVFSRGQIPPFGGQAAEARLDPNLLLEGGLLALSLLTVALDFALTIALGGLASSAGRTRGGSLAIAVLGRVLASGLLLSLTSGVTFALTQTFANPFPALYTALIGLFRLEVRGTPVWTWAWSLLNTPTETYAVQVIIAIVGLGITGLVLAAIVRLTIWRTRRPMQG